MRFKDHELTLKEQPDGRWTGRCSCGRWAGLGKNKAYVVSQWNKKHINKMDTWK